MAGNEDHLAYGNAPGQPSDRATGSGGARGFLGDTLRTFRDKYAHHGGQQQGQHGQQGQQGHQGQQYPGQPSNQGYNPQAQYQQTPQGQQGTSQYGPDPTHGQNPQYYQGTDGGSHSGGKPPKTDLVSGIFGKIQGIGSEMAQRIGSNLDPQAYATYGVGATSSNSKNRYGSFAPTRDHCDAKWYVDGCSYMWAVSRALETAKESIWILDWWLSPELYLRRPPAQNEQYRIDRMLQAAAQRGVRVNIIVYKEVTQALSLSSSHTKHHLEDLHENITVLRHPDHLPDKQTVHSDVMSSFQNLTLNAAGVSKLSGDALKAVYGLSGGVVLFWAHHEKLCLVDGKTAFMGGLDLCFGRWDTYQHSIADVHPADVKQAVFPGQDYNNARVLDFQDVVHWENNQLDRKSNSRMGWSDVAVSLHGPVVEDLRKHFVDRWNFIYDEKYAVRKNPRVSRLELYRQPMGMGMGSHHSSSQYNAPPSGAPPATGSQGYQQPSGGYGSAQQYPSSNQPQTQTQPQTQPQGSQSQYYPPPPPGPPPVTSPAAGGYQPPTQASQVPYFPPPPGQGNPPTQSRGIDEYNEGEGSSRGVGGLKGEFTSFGSTLRSQLAGQVHRYQDRYLTGGISGQSQGQQMANVSCQIVRSSAKWSNGTETEHSIADAYAAIIRESDHFIYIENQFFITATSDAQKPVKNKIGAAIVERILRAAKAGEKYKVIVIIPAVPGFPGDLREDGSLGTRAIMEFQYFSINRGGNSIMEVIAREGYNPMDYIRFYNLRNYDRINASAIMRQAEMASGVNYEDARKQHDAAMSASRPTAFDTTAAYPQYQQAAQNVAATHPQSSAMGRWDTVSGCYMLGGEDIRNIPWEHEGDVSEIDAFVTEELYVHSKVMIADDRTVICGSANLNDRSQLGDHDSEIAVIIQDPSAMESKMNGQTYVVSQFATTLRRQLCRKHLGLIRPQDFQRGDANCEPVGVPNQYDFGTPEDNIVADPIADTFHSLWNSRAKQNTEVYRKVFHVVPDDTVRNWNDYKEFYEYNFRKPDGKENQQQGGQQMEQGGQPRYLPGHVIRDEFPEGVKAVKEELAKVKGTIVEMPLMFLAEEDIAKEGLNLNSFTETLYT
ncbi:phospholipase D Active site domain-containing protein [Arthroderma uncinatum]|uniref:phospholipase D Active site domain-containing protein n=1 Tax=Arthroderma uncinatum TaxID=74035 RepID=UPI00144A88C7|nr:phospholipase D Active site domain-containing protein [Arthroderma uncinatum]KAF3483297.1 phospholipase D Active site domain-containing protein [Arthroderma uncinatum]